MAGLTGGRNPRTRHPDAYRLVDEGVKSVRPRAAIVGLGSYFRKLRVGINKYLDPVKFLDTRPAEALDLLAAERERFAQVNSDLKQSVERRRG